MRVIYSLLLCLLLSPAAPAQTKPLLERKGEAQFGGPEDRVVIHKLLERENRLLLVGRKTAGLLDFAAGKIVETSQLDLPEIFAERSRLISPDGRRILIFSGYSYGKKDKEKRPAAVWDLRTGKQVAVLDKTTKPIRSGAWSANGKTLATSSDLYAPLGADSGGIEVTFWDGETFQYKNTLPSSKASWWYLTPDGRRCIFSSYESRNFIIDKWYTNAGPIAVWDVEGAKVEQTITGQEGSAERKIRWMTVSAGGRFLSFVVQPPKSNNTERRLAVWELPADGSAPFEIRPRYELKPNPKIYEYGGQYSPDGKYLTLPAGKVLQIYDAATGKQVFELPVDRHPGNWLVDNKVLLVDYGSKLEAYEAATGRKLYEQELVSIWTTYTSDDSGIPYNEPVDTTKIISHPGCQMFLTYSKQYVKVFDARTGALLQTLVSPPMDYSRKKPRLSDKPLVSRAGWSEDGKTLYIIGDDLRTVSLWGLSES